MAVTPEVLEEAAADLARGALIPSSVYFVVDRPRRPRAAAHVRSTAAMTRGREALAHQVLIEARVARAGQLARLLPPSQLLLHRPGDERAFVLVAEDRRRPPRRRRACRHRAPAARRCARSRRALDLGRPCARTRARAARRRGRRSRRDALMARRSVQRRDGRESSSRAAAFGDAQRAAREHVKRVEVGRHTRRRAQLPKRMMSDCTTPRDWAISSRACSAVVEMPWTLSLNSSTFDAQRSASSSVTKPCW